MGMFFVSWLFIAATGMKVPETDFTLSSDFGTFSIWANKTNEVAFFASFRDSTTNRFFRALWVAGRDGRLRRVCYVGQELNVGGTNRIVAAVGTAVLVPVFNNDGMLVMQATFRDGTVALLRGVPPAFQDREELCCESGSGVEPQRQAMLREVRPSGPPPDCEVFTFNVSALLQTLPKGAQAVCHPIG
jgi:hypothetical protein